MTLWGLCSGVSHGLGVVSKAFHPDKLEWQSKNAGICLIYSASRDLPDLTKAMFCVKANAVKDCIYAVQAFM